MSSKRTFTRRVSGVEYKRDLIFSDCIDNGNFAARIVEPSKTE